MNLRLENTIETYILINSVVIIHQITLCYSNQGLSVNIVSSYDVSLISIYHKVKISLIQYV